MKPTFKDAYRQLRSRVKRFSQDRNWGTFALFILFATLLWWGHASNSVRERDIIVPIAYIGIPDDICFDTDLPKQVTIRLRDQGKRLSHYQYKLKTGISLDLHETHWQKEGHLHIAAEQLRPLLTDLFQGTARVQQITPEAIDRHYAKQQSKIVSVRLNADLQTAKQYDFLQPLEYEPQSIKIFGSKAALDSIKEIETENCIQRDLKTSGTRRVALALPAGVRAELDSISVSYVVEQYTEKVFQSPVVVISHQSVLKSQSIMVFPQTVEVIVRVPMSKFQEVTENDVRVTCPYPTTPTETLPLTAEPLSPNILSVRVNPSDVEYIIVN